jgi:FkbM family methyltransferase
MNKIEIKNLINKSNPIIFEIGCADGIDTREFINVFGGLATFYCFEPDDRNSDIFKNGGYRPIDPSFTNGINNDNVIFENKAIGNVDGIVEFNQSSTIYSSSLKKPTDELFREWPVITFDKILKVECVKLDTYVKDKNIEIIDFIWADVQGAEDLMILGGKETFKNKVRFLYSEYANKEYYESSPNQNAILKLLGDDWEIIQDFGTDVLLRNKTL